jgi:hypothetical protein
LSFGLSKNHGDSLFRFSSAAAAGPKELSYAGERGLRTRSRGTIHLAPVCLRSRGLWPAGIVHSAAIIANNREGVPISGRRWPLILCRRARAIDRFVCTHHLCVSANSIASRGPRSATRAKRPRLVLREEFRLMKDYAIYFGYDSREAPALPGRPL